ncbi:DUF1850 domain-containing protein [Halobacteriales archaeon QS_1_67_19]|nr:MAG: DUF1850 domain-containing protein [Halobacteriales archaeon QS_1_67_19]
MVVACGLVASAVGVGAFAAGPTAVGPAAANDARLVVTDTETGERLLVAPVSEGTTVALNYTHSVEQTPVLDVYEVNGTDLEMVRMEFQSYGAGLPAREAVTVTENDTFVFDPDRRYERLHVKPGEIAGHELIVGDRTYDLVALSDARSVTIRVTNRSLEPTTPTPD